MQELKTNVETLTSHLNETLEEIRLRRCALVKYEQEVINEYHKELERLLLNTLNSAQ